ncbi:MAG: ribosome silencing factor [Bacteroidales bacterium]|nr:ribosome silencing factor [Bacteroidales bacterium]
MPKTSKKVVNQAYKISDADTLAAIVVEALQEIKGRDITEIRFGESVEHPLFDAFILCSATSNVQAEALCDNVQRRVYEKLHLEPSHYEGRNEAQWILIDYFNVLVHIFLEDKRQFYNLEGLWNDAEIRHCEEPVQTVQTH